MNVLEAARRILASDPITEVSRRIPAMPTTLVAGGALRDLLLGRPVHDLDLVVIGEAEPVARELASALHGHTFQLGSPPKAVWRVTAPDLAIDIWETQRSLEHDILRRDFTVNALMWRLPRGPLLDLAGGLEDLAAGRIRVVDPRNLETDPIRVLRGIRMLATHPELALTAATGEHLARCAVGLRRAPAERIRAELELLLAGDDPGRALRAAHRHGVLAALEPAWSGERGARAAAAIADRLAMVRRGSRGWLRAGAVAAFPVALALPAAGPASRWQPVAATSSLRRMGWPARTGATVGAVGAAGYRLAVALRRRRAADLREAAVVADDALDPALALACALAGADRATRRRVLRLRSWATGFAARPPLLDGVEVAAILDLQPGPARAAAIRSLRVAQARGEVRTRTGAAEWLATSESLTPRSGGW